ncbi:TraR/DksA C4-type zinc finger protein [Halopseudomonas sp.]|uniref:TraR/DksA family transcriptional regulator n=1 Tax=Halopseudomonas sp. TaxID=2901191 RepID=UPI00311E2ADE
MDNQIAAANLRALYDEYAQRLDALERDLRSGHSADSAEQAQERENDDVMRSLKLEAEAGLRDVEGALQRLREGHYGQCQRCGVDIAEARLQVLPATPWCSACADQA